MAWVAKVAPGSIPEAESALIRLEALGATRRWREVEQEGKRYAEKFPAGPRRSEAAFATAVAIEARAGRRRRPRCSARSGPRSLGDLESAGRRPAGEVRAGGGVQARQDWVARGMVLFDRHQNEASEAAFARALGRGPS